MYDAIQEDGEFIIVDDDGRYYCQTDTEEKCDTLLHLLNESLSDFESGNYDIATDEEIAYALKSLEVRK